MGVLHGCIKCKDLSKNPISPCAHITAPDNTGYPYDLAKLGYGHCKIDKCNYLVNADRLCKNYKPSKKL